MYLSDSTVYVVYLLSVNNFKVSHLLTHTLDTSSDAACNSVPGEAVSNSLLLTARSVNHYRPMMFMLLNASKPANLNN